MRLQRVVLQRCFMSENATFGALTILNLKHPPIWTIEEPWRDNKQYVSCVPAGSYLVRPHSGTKYHGKDPTRVSDDAYVLAHVPGREAVLIHVGNTLEDTEGCILPGRAAGTLGGKDAVLNSTSAMKILLEKIGRKDFELLILDCPRQSDF